MRTLNLTSVLLGLCCLLGIASSAWAQYPDPANAPAGFPLWWFEQGVIVPSNHTNATPTWPGDYSTSDDYSVINQGTLKNLAVGALATIQAQFPPNVLTNSNAIALANLVNGWTTNPSSTADNYAAVNQGQLKYIASKFYDVLGSGSYTAGLGLQPTNWANGTYPWSTNANTPDAYAAVIIGQAKYVFSFDLTAPPGQLPAWWAQYYFGTTGIDPNTLSPSGDYNTLWQDYQLHHNPNDFYNGQLPNLIKTGGDVQTGAPGSLLPLALSVSLTDSSNNPLVDAPIVFSVPSGSGLLQVSSVASTTTSVSIRTDSLGTAKVYFQLPSGANQTDTITCTAATGTQSRSISFSEKSVSGTASTPSPFAPSNVNSVMNPDGSIDFTWTSQADPSDTTEIPVRYQDTNGNWITYDHVLINQQSYHLPYIP